MWLKALATGQSGADLHGQLKAAPRAVVARGQAKPLIDAFAARRSDGASRMTINDILDFLHGVGGAVDTLTKFNFLDS